MTIAEQITRAKQDYDEVYDAGKQAEWNAFWDGFQNFGNRVDYSSAFAQTRLTDETFKPKYDMRVGNGYYMFFNTVGITDLTKIGVELDFSNCTRLQCAFQSMSDHAGGIGIKKIGIVDARNGTMGEYELQLTFAYNPFLEEIEKVILKDDGSQGFYSTFVWCAALKEIRFEGVIGYDITFDYSPLSKASIENIINHLSSSTSGKTLTLKKTAKEAAFTDSEWNALIATKPNWTISLV